MNQLAAIRMFAKVAESLNFASAANQLGVSSAVVSRGIATLEAHLNTRLLNRAKRQISLTEAGQAYLQGCTELLTQLEVLDAQVSSSIQASVGSLKIAASELFAATYLSDLLTAYREAEPGARFETTVFASTRDLDGNDYDVQFSAERRLRDSSLVCRPLLQCRDAIVASPTYITRCGSPDIPQNLPHHDVLLASNASTRHWEFRDTYGPRRVSVNPIFTSPSLMAVKRAALAGLGVARLPRLLVESHLRAGTLKLLLDQFNLEGNDRTMWMFYSGRRYITQRVRSFVDFAVARCRERYVGQDR